MALIDTHISYHAASYGRTSAAALVKAGLDRLSAGIIAVLDWQYQARERRQLRRLSDRALQDFGACRADAESEGAKPFWQR
jgi:uncharacterized protein YjiS (DUF1127 family)